MGCAVCAQQAVFGQGSFENTSGETADRLDTIIESFGTIKTRKYHPAKPDHYCLHDGIGICNLWPVHWAGTQTFCLYEETLSNCLFCTNCSCHSYTRTIHS